MAELDPLVRQANNDAPALSATSDMPVAAQQAPEPAAPDTTTDPPPAPEEPPAPAPAEEPPAPDGEQAAAEAEAEPPARAERKPPAEQMRERLSEMAAHRRQAELRADRLAESLEKALGALDRASQREPAKPAEEQAPQPVVKPRPDRDQYGDPRSYDDALVEWSTEQATAIAYAKFQRQLLEQRQRDEQAIAEQRQTERWERTRATWQERKQQAIERLPDYVEVAEADDVPISTSMAMIIQHAENGPEIAYHLGKHVDEAARIAAMVVPGQYFPQGHPEQGQPVPDVQRQLFELGRIAALAAAPRPEVSRAPRPIKPLGSNGAARTKTPAEMTTEEYAAWRMPQLQAERRPGMLGVPVGEVRRPG